MQVILGSGGAIGRPLAAALSAYTDHVRCCSRTPHALPEQAGTRYEHLVTDLLDASAVRRAVRGAEVVYLTAGLPYRRKVWRRDWPRVIDHVLAACRQAGARLAFFDNVYALDPNEYGHMTEGSALRPASEKGKVRAGVLQQLWSAHAAGEVTVAVARAADFYGPGVPSSLLNAMVLDKIAAGGTPLWVGPTDLPHSFTYTPDAGRHFALLGNDARAWGRTWHLPTDPNPRTLSEIAALANQQAGQSARLRRLPKPLFRLLGAANADLRELWDVREQFFRPYVFRSDLFAQTFGAVATPLAEGLADAMR